MLIANDPKRYELREKIRKCGYNPDKILALFEEELLWFANEWTDEVLKMVKEKDAINKKQEK